MSSRVQPKPKEGTSNNGDETSRKDDDWRKYHNPLVSKMVEERLRDANRTKDKNLLSKAISEYEGSGREGADGNIADAKRTLDILEEKQRLVDSSRAKDGLAILEALAAIEDKRYEQYLQREIHEAKFQLDVLQRQHAKKRKILPMNHNTMSEIRRYHNPPRVLHRVVQAVLLLMGEDEFTTGSWRECQRLTNPQGQGGLNRRVLNFDPTDVHSEIAARAQEILEEMTVEEVKAVSAGGATFYVWAMGVVEEAKNNEDSQGSGRPADLHRQREIFGKASVVHLSPRRGRKNWAH